MDVSGSPAASTRDGKTDRPQDAPGERAGRAGSGTHADTDADVVAEVLAGDEDAFTALVRAHTPSMLRVAAGYVPSQAVAEEVVQETWLTVLGGLAGFEGRSSLRTWIFGVLVNVARRRGERERRSVPFSSAFGPRSGSGSGSGPEFGSGGGYSAGPPDFPAGARSVDPNRFVPPGAGGEGSWSSPPSPWELPEPALLNSETRTVLREAITALPPRQRTVLELRDVEGFDSDTVCKLLDVSPGNQRVLLHRARARLRAVLEKYLDGVGT